MGYGCASLKQNEYNKKSSINYENFKFILPSKYLYMALNLKFNASRIPKIFPPQIMDRQRKYYAIAIIVQSNDATL